MIASTEMKNLGIIVSTKIVGPFGKWLIPRSSAWKDVPDKPVTSKETAKTKSDQSNYDVITLMYLLDLEIKWDKTAIKKKYTG